MDYPGRGAQDGHLDFHTAAELSRAIWGLKTQPDGLTGTVQSSPFSARRDSPKYIRKVPLQKALLSTRFTSLHSHSNAKGAERSSRDVQQWQPRVTKRNRNTHSSTITSDIHTPAILLM